MGRVFSDDPNWPLASWRVAKNESRAVIRHGARTWAAIWEQYLQELLEKKRRTKRRNDLL